MHLEAEAERRPALLQDLHLAVLGEEVGPGRQVVGHPPDVVEVRVDHDRVDLAEHNIDTAGDTGHDRPGSDSHKTRHQSVLDQILSSRILPDLKPHRIFH